MTELGLEERSQAGIHSVGFAVDQEAHLRRHRRDPGADLQEVSRQENLHKDSEADRLEVAGRRLQEGSHLGESGTECPGDHQTSQHKGSEAALLEEAHLQERHRDSEAGSLAERRHKGSEADQHQAGNHLGGFEAGFPEEEHQRSQHKDSGADQAEARPRERHQEGSHSEESAADRLEAETQVALEADLPEEHSGHHRDSGAVVVLAAGNHWAGPEVVLLGLASH